MSDTNTERKWVRDEGDSCPKCGATIEVLVKRDNKFSGDIGFPTAERCTECEWFHEFESGGE